MPAALLCWAIATPSHATTIDPHAAERTFATADAIVEGLVVGTRETIIDEGLPITYYRIQVSDVLKGETGDYVELLLPGGWTEDHNYVHVHGRPHMQVGDPILVALSHIQIEDDSVAQMATFSVGFAREDASWGGAPVVVNGNGVPIRDYSDMTPQVVEDPALPDLVGECDPNSQLAAAPLLSWNQLRDQWSARIENMAWDDDFNPGIPFADAGGQP